MSSEQAPNHCPCLSPTERSRSGCRSLPLLSWGVQATAAVGRPAGVRWSLLPYQESTQGLLHLHTPYQGAHDQQTLRKEAESISNKQPLKFGQNGEVKRLKLTSPYKNTKITTAEKLSTKKPGTYPKKAMRWRSHEMVGGVLSQYNQIPYQLVGRPTDWIITVSQRSPTGVLVLTPLQAPEPDGLAVQGGASSIWLWKPAVLECRISPRLVETETPRLDGAQIISCTLGPRTKQWLHRSLD